MSWRTSLLVYGATLGAFAGLKIAGAAATWSWWWWLLPIVPVVAHRAIWRCC